MTTKRNKILELSIHVFCWGIFIGFPYFMATMRNESTVNFHVVESFLYALPYILIFYANYLFLAEKFLFGKRNILLFVLCNVIAIVLCMGLAHLIHHALMPGPPPQRRHMPPLEEVLIRQSASLALIAALGLALRATSYSFSKQVEVEKYKREKTAAELQNLKNQINPHFLFNCLNSIYALAAIDSEKAQFAIHSLSDLMRYVLYKSDSETVPLGDEIKFINSYCDLMRLRCGDNVKIEIENNLPEKANDLQIAPLLFISLVENAFKHGIDASEN